MQTFQVIVHIVGAVHESDAGRPELRCDLGLPCMSPQVHLKNEKEQTTEDLQQNIFLPAPHR